jgi:DNA end-binding protein Ku
MPVALTPAVRGAKRQFHLLHRGDNGRLRIRLVCSRDNSAVHPEHVLRGHPVGDDKYVIVRDSEIEAIAPGRSRSIEISSFVPLDQVSPLRYRHPYYLVPTSAEKPYRLLAQTLAHARKAGIAEFVMHQRQHLAAVISVSGALCLATLYYPADIRAPDELVTSAQAQPKRVEQLLGEMRKLRRDFDPAALRDVYADRVEELISGKQAAGEVVVMPSTQEPQPADEAIEGMDLIEALEASLAKSRRKAS